MPENGNESVRQALVVMLRQCADYLAQLPSSDVDALVQGGLEVRLSVAQKKARGKARQQSALTKEQIVDVVASLRACESRSDGERLLRERASAKSPLESIARYLDAPVRREDRYEDLLRKVIEATIGYRLSSAAIQGRSSPQAEAERPSSLLPLTKK